jgi:hypothetical protein
MESTRPAPCSIQPEKEPARWRLHEGVGYVSPRVDWQREAVSLRRLTLRLEVVRGELGEGVGGGFLEAR